MRPEREDDPVTLKEAPAFTSTLSANNGPSEMERISIARAALRASLQKPKKNSPNTSDQNIHRRQRQHHS